MRGSHVKIFEVELINKMNIIKDILNFIYNTTMICLCV